MRESRTLDLRRDVSRTFLKTVSAFANYGTGEIWFGIDDDGTAVGLSNSAEASLAIENAVNDSFRKIIVVGGSQRPWHDGNGIATMGIRQFLLDPNSLDWRVQDEG